MCGADGSLAGATPSQLGDPLIGEGNIIVQVVPAVVVGSAVLVAAVVVFVVLMRRKKKKKSQQGIRMSVKNSLNTSKYGIERNALRKTENRAWEPPVDSE